MPQGCSQGSSERVHVVIAVGAHVVICGIARGVVGGVLNLVFVGGLAGDAADVAVEPSAAVAADKCVSISDAQKSSPSSS